MRGWEGGANKGKKAEGRQGKGAVVVLLPRQKQAVKGAWEARRNSDADADIEKRYVVSEELFDYSISGIERV